MSEEETLTIKEKISFPFDVKLEAVDPLVAHSNYHLSLTRTLYVKDHQRELFQSKVSDALKKTLTEAPLPGQVGTERFSVYLNDEASRTFIAIDLEGNASILKYIQAIDNVLKEFGLPAYYAPPKLHFSLAWCRGNRRRELVFGEKDEKIALQIELKQILLKCGNKVSRIM